MRSTVLSRYKLISFDVTGTLIRLRHSPGTIYAKVAREEGYGELDAAVLDIGFKNNFKSLSKQLPNYGQKQEMNWRTWWSMLVIKTFKDSTNDIVESKLPVLADKLINLYETGECWTASDDALQFVHYVKDKGLRTGIITNSDPRTNIILRNLNFPEFDFVLSAFDAGTTKPDPKVFEMALEMCGDTAIRPDQALHVGNDRLLDYDAANNCSWTGVLIDNALQRDQPEDYKFRNLSTLLRYLQKDSIN